MTLVLEDENGWLSKLPLVSVEASANLVIYKKGQYDTSLVDGGQKSQTLLFLWQGWGIALFIGRFLDQLCFHFQIGPFFKMAAGGGGPPPLDHQSLPPSNFPVVDPDLYYLAIN